MLRDIAPKGGELLVIKIKQLLATFIAFLLLGMFPVLTYAAMPQKSTSDVQMLSDASIVSPDGSHLTRFDNGVFVRLNTTGLTPKEVDTLWWVVFNNPENCSHGTGGFRCGEGDLPPFGGDPSVQASVMYADGRIIGSSGNAHYASYLRTGDTAGALFGPGLLNPMTADVHLVVRSHGQLIPTLVGEQLHTFGGGCNNPDIPPGTGTPGHNTCIDLQFAVHEQ